MIFIRPLSIEAADVAAAVQRAAAEMTRKIPVQAVFMSPADHAALAGSSELPIHLYPEDAARAWARWRGTSRWRERPELPAPSFADLRPDEAAAILAEALAEDREWLGAEECAGFSTATASRCPSRARPATRRTQARPRRSSAAAWR